MGKYTYSTRCAKPGCAVFIKNTDLRAEIHGCSDMDCKNTFFCKAHLEHKKHLDVHRGINRASIEERIHRRHAVNSKRSLRLDQVTIAPAITDTEIIFALRELCTDWRAVANFELDDSDSGICEKCLSLCAFFGYRHEVNKTFKCDKHVGDHGYKAVRFVTTNLVHKILEAIEGISDGNHTPKSRTLLCFTDANKFLFSSRFSITLDEANTELSVIGNTTDVRRFKKGSYVHVYPKTDSTSRTVELLNAVWEPRKHTTLQNACVVIVGSSPQRAKLAANFHVDRLPPRCLAFGIELNSFQTIDEEDVVSYWFLVGDQDIADFSNYLSDNYGRQVETFLPTSLEEARKIQVEFGRIGERFRFQIVSQRSGELISLASGVWHAVLNIKPIYKLTWDCLDKSDFADIVRLRRLHFQSGHKPQLDFSKIELHIRDLIQ